jgi:tetratricopeptide (TPR) repeat protein
MFELIIIISLAIIFFIFLIRMPEVEKIEGREKGRRTPIFKGDLRKIFNFIKKIKLPKYKLKALKPEPKKETVGETKDLFFEAERKLKFGDLDGAEKLYLRLAVVSPNDAAIYASLGRIYLERQNLKDAISSFKAAINRDQKNGFYYYDLATALYKDEKYKEAIVCFEKSILINNRIPIRHLGLGLALMKIGENERAADSFRKAIFIEPNNEKYQRLLKKAQSKKYSSTLN